MKAHINFSNNSLKGIYEEAPFALSAIIIFLSLVFLLLIPLGLNEVLVDNKSVLKVARNFFDIGNIILFFLIFISCYYSYLTRNYTKLFAFSILFLFLGCLELYLYNFSFYNHIVSRGSGREYLHLYAFQRYCLALGLSYIHSMDVKDKTQTGYKSLIFVLPVVTLIISGLLAWIFSEMTKYFDVEVLRTVGFYAEFILFAIFIFGIYQIVKVYRLERLPSLINLGCASSVFAIAELQYIINFNYGPLSYMIYSFYSFFGLLLILESVFRYNVSQGTEEIKMQEEQLKLYADRLDVVIEKRTQKVQDKNKHFISELEYAKLIQQSLLPQKRIHFKNSTNFVNEYFPCERLSGDFYDIYKIDEDNIAMYILDVSGHGISAALMTMFCNNYIKSTERLIKRYRGLKPHRNLKHFYEEFNKMNFPEEMHMVIFFASYNVVSKVLTYCSGGMNCDPIVFRGDGTYEYLDKSRGFPICRLSEFFEPEYHSEKIQLEKGDKVIFYTDGLTDKLKNNILDADELTTIFTENYKESAKDINEKILEKIYPKADSLDDDISYFIMEI